jgi:GTP cyclohydrolase FolE2
MTITERVVVSTTFPDLHSQSPALPLSVKSVGHRGVKRPLLLDGQPAMGIIDVAVGLLPAQRGAHMSRLIDCLSHRSTATCLRSYMSECLTNLQSAVPDAASWSLRASVTRLLIVPDGVKPIDEVCRIEAQADATASLTWGVALKVCLACPQAQAGIAHDRNDEENVGMHPSHNQVCDLTMTVTGDFAVGASLTATDLVELGESAASGRVRERYKRRGEADCVTEVHHKARFAEDALRGLAWALRERCPEASDVECDIVNYESIFEYPLHCRVTL